MEPFKNELNAGRIEAAATHFARVYPAFDGPSFVAMANRGLSGLELKERVAHISVALRGALPEGWDHACRVMLDALGEPTDPDSPGAADTGDDGIRGWMVWPMTHLVQTAGLEQPGVSLQTLHGLTQRFSAEFAIRHFILRWPDQTFEALRQWVTDPSPHVRRLVSEGSRPRLPWGVQLRPLVDDPTRSLGLIEQLVDDPSPYVRRSVANHLGDVCKDHPVLAVQTAQEWWSESVERRRLVRHGLRWLIKQGDPGALAVLGYGPPSVDAVVKVGPNTVAVGNAVQIELSLTSKSNQNLMIDYVIHYVKARGTSAKVFKWGTRKLRKGQTIVLTKKHAMKQVSTRVLRPGVHRVQAQINGVLFGDAAFELE